MPQLSGVGFYRVNDARKNDPKVSLKRSIRGVPSTKNFLRYRGHGKMHLSLMDFSLYGAARRTISRGFTHPWCPARSQRTLMRMGHLRTSLAHWVAPTATVSFWPARSEERRVGKDRRFG